MSFSEWLLWLLLANFLITFWFHFTFVVWLSKPVIQAQNNKELRQKYKPFWRNDTHLFKLFNPRVFLQQYTMFIRGMIAWVLVFLTCIWVVLLTTGLDLEKPLIVGKRR